MLDHAYVENDFAFCIKYTFYEAKFIGFIVIYSG